MSGVRSRHLARKDAPVTSGAFAYCRLMPVVVANSSSCGGSSIAHVRATGRFDLGDGGRGLWLSQALLLVVRCGVTPNAQIETVTFGVGFAAFTAAGLVAWGSTATRRPAARAVRR